MSMMPAIPCKLKNGKALKAFTTFVATFNWMVDFCRNLRGEHELTYPDEESSTGGTSTGSGSASEEYPAVKGPWVDRTISDHPVIRCSGCQGGGGAVGCIKDIRLNVVTNCIEVEYDDNPGVWVSKIDVIKHSEV